jgi:prepilin signal peptidase PulO-like enzyme (type II secretory pathway)
VERSAVLLFNSLFLFSLFQAWRLRADPAANLRWLTRAIGVLLGIATTRPVMGIFFATSRFTHLLPQQFFGLAFWIGFSINTVIVELWLRSRGGAAQIEKMAVR